MDSQPLLTPHI